MMIDDDAGDDDDDDVCVHVCNVCCAYDVDAAGDDNAAFMMMTMMRVVNYEDEDEELDGSYDSDDILFES